MYTYFTMDFNFLNLICLIFYICNSGSDEISGIYNFFFFLIIWRQIYTKVKVIYIGES